MNREIYPANLYPISGDVQSQAGNTNVKVTGIQGISIQSTFLNGGEVPTYNPAINKWVLQSNSRIQINNITVSDDYYVSINAPKQIKINGV